MAGQIVLGLGVVRLGRLANEKAEVGHDGGGGKSAHRCCSCFLLVVVVDYGFATVINRVAFVLAAIVCLSIDSSTPAKLGLSAFLRYFPNRLAPDVGGLRERHCAPGGERRSRRGRRRGSSRRSTRDIRLSDGVTSSGSRVPRRPPSHGAPRRSCRRCPIGGEVFLGKAFSDRHGSSVDLFAGLPGKLPGTMAGDVDDAVGEELH